MSFSDALASQCNEIITSEPVQLRTLNNEKSRNKKANFKNSELSQDEEGWGESLNQKNETGKWEDVWKEVTVPSRRCKNLHSNKKVIQNSILL